MKISPSLLSCNFSQMGKEIEKMINAGAEWIHFDVMDGHFVPNITFGAPVIKCLREGASAIFDVHLMISNPIKYIDDFADAGADYITFHFESNSDIQKTIEKIKSRGCKVGLTLKPGTPVESLLPYIKEIDLALVMTVEPGFSGQKFMENQAIKIKAIAQEAKRLNKSIEIMVDGGVNKENISLCAEMGATVVVSGNAVFKSENPKETIAMLKNKATSKT